MPRTRYTPGEFRDRCYRDKCTGTHRITGMAVKLSVVVLVLALSGAYTAPLYREQLFDAAYGVDTECTGVSVSDTITDILLHDCATRCTGLSACLAFNWSSGNVCTLLAGTCGTPNTGVTGTTYFEKK